MKKEIKNHLGAGILKEDTARATAHVRHFIKDDLTRETIVSADPLHYRDKKTGKWKEFDPTLKKDGDGYTARMGNGTARLTAPDGKGSVCFSDGGRTVSWQFLGADGTSLFRDLLPRARRSAKRPPKLKKAAPAEHSDPFSPVGKAGLSASDGIDIEYCIEGTRLKENILLKEKRDLYRLRYSLCAVGLRAEKDEKGNILFFPLTGEQTDAPAYLMQAPFMYSIVHNPPYVYLGRNVSIANHTYKTEKFEPYASTFELLDKFTIEGKKIEEIWQDITMCDTGVCHEREKDTLPAPEDPLQVFHTGTEENIEVKKANLRKRYYTGLILTIVLDLLAISCLLLCLIHHPFNTISDGSKSIGLLVWFMVIIVLLGSVYGLTTSLVGYMIDRKKLKSGSFSIIRGRFVRCKLCWHGEHGWGGITRRALVGCPDANGVEFRLAVSGEKLIPGAYYEFRYLPNTGIAYVSMRYYENGNEQND